MLTRCWSHNSENAVNDLHTDTHHKVKQSIALLSSYLFLATTLWGSTSKWWNWGLEKLGTLSKVTQLVDGSVHTRFKILHLFLLSLSDTRGEKIPYIVIRVQEESLWEGNQRGHPSVPRDGRPGTVRWPQFWGRRAGSRPALSATSTWGNLSLNLN